MKITKIASGFTLETEQADLIEKKFQRVKYVEDSLLDITVRVKLDKKYIFDCNAHFSWGTPVHVSAEDYDFEAALNAMMDVLDQKIKKEKDKAKGH